jgi:hypothetical protein
MSCVLDSLTTTHGEAGLTDLHSSAWRLTRGRRARGSIELGSGDLSDQACLQWQEDSYSLGVVCSGRMTLRLALSQAPEHVEGKE